MNAMKTNCQKHGLEVATTTYGTLVNDHHSSLNPTYVSQVRTPQSLSELGDLVKEAARTGGQIAIAGGRHAMGGQQFLTDEILVDMTSLNKIICFDRESGTIEVEAGIMWPTLIDYLKQSQTESAVKWTIAQKQTGCDLLSIGGALSANVHGRGLNKAPIVSDVQEFNIVMHDGCTRKCDREHNTELFSLAIGGYGLFGIISTVTLRLTPRATLRRSVEVCTSEQVVEKLEQQKLNGATFGDFQFAIDSHSPDFLQSGILSTYTPVIAELNNSEQKLLAEHEWEELLYLAHTNKTRAFDSYKSHYLSTNGQLYLSDTFQLATYINGYHTKIDNRVNSLCRGSEAITELYVPRLRLGEFMKRAASLLRDHQANLIYGTVRLIEKDNETFLAWATERWACIIFNLHVDHNWASLEAVGNVFRKLYQLSIEFGGKYYLTYNKFAAPNQLQSCYPQIVEFVELKQKYDPGSRFSSDWFNYVLNSRNYF